MFRQFKHHSGPVREMFSILLYRTEIKGISLSRGHRYRVTESGIELRLFHQKFTPLAFHDIEKHPVRNETSTGH